MLRSLSGTLWKGLKFLFYDGPITGHADHDVGLISAAVTCRIYRIYSSGDNLATKGSTGFNTSRFRKKKNFTEVKDVLKCSMKCENNRFIKNRLILSNIYYVILITMLQFILMFLHIHGDIRRWKHTRRKKIVKKSI